MKNIKGLLVVGFLLSGSMIFSAETPQYRYIGDEAVKHLAATKENNLLNLSNPMGQLHSRQNITLREDINLSDSKSTIFSTEETQYQYVDDEAVKHLAATGKCEGCDLLNKILQKASIAATTANNLLNLSNPMAQLHSRQNITLPENINLSNYSAVLK